MTSPLVSPALRPVSTVDAAASALRHAIATRHYPPGARIKEIPVAAELGLSRGPVRDALRVLAEEGLVRLTTNQGATVADVEADDLMELYAHRLALGSLAIRRILGQGQTLEKARSHLEALQSAVKQRRAGAAVEADLSLQDALVRASGLERTAQLFERTTVQLRVYVGVLGLDFRPLLPAMYDEDQHLLDAIDANKQATALEAWRAKLEGWARTFVHHHGDAFDGEAWLTIYSGKP